MHIEKKLKENKWYLLQLDFWKPDFLYHIFGLSFDILDDSSYFNLHFILFGSFLKFDLAWTRRTDHCGFNFDFSIIGLNFIVNIYDIRHWNHETNNYCTEVDYLEITLPPDEDIDDNGKYIGNDPQFMDLQMDKTKKVIIEKIKEQ